MEVCYKQEVTHSFLVIQPDGEVNTKAYPLRMILGNSIPGLLRCRLQKADGKVWFYYDITARQQLCDLGQKLAYEELRKIYQGLLKIFEQMDGYLLDANQLLLDAEYIYLDKQTGNLSLCYLPGYEKPLQEQLRCFAEYLLALVDHQDSRGVALSYGVYRLLAKKSFQTEAVEEIIRKAEAQGSGDTKEAQAIPKQREPFPSIQKNAAAKDGQKKKTPIRRRAFTAKQIFFFFAGFFLLAGLLVIRRMGYLSDITLPVMLAAVFGTILAAAWIARKEKRNPPDETLCEPPPCQEPALICEEAAQVPPVLLDQEMIPIGETDGEGSAKIQRKEDGYWISAPALGQEIFLNGKKLEDKEEYLLQPEDRIVCEGRCYRFTQ